MIYSTSSLLVAGIVLPVLGLIAVSIRFYARLRPKRTMLGADDWLILTAAILTCAMGALQITGAYIGDYGRQGQVEEADHEVATNKINYITIVIEKPIYGFIKLSVLLFYRRIFVFPWFTMLNNILIVLTFLWTIAFFLADTFVCGIYPEVMWSDAHPSIQCANVEWILLFFAITDVIGDIIILSMPYPCIRKLQLTLQRKIALAGLFLLGTLAVIAGIIRLGFVAQNFAPKDENVKNAAGQNLVTSSDGPGLWTLVEVSVGVIAACLPILAPLLWKIPGPSRLVSYLKQVSFDRSLRQKSSKLGDEDSAGSRSNSTEAQLVAHPAALATPGPMRDDTYRIGIDDLEMVKTSFDVDVDVEKGLNG